MGLFTGSSASGRRRRTVGVIGAAALAAGTSVAVAPPALAATGSVTSGGYTASGVTYAKQGDVLALGVSTRRNPGGNPVTKCVAFHDVTGASPVFLGAVWDSSKSTSWSFSITAPAGSDGQRTVRATPHTDAKTTDDKGRIVDLVGSGSSTTSNPCQTVDAADQPAEIGYRLRNTPPSIVAAHAPAAGTPAAQNGWYRGDVVVSWTCSDNSGTGLTALGCPAPITIGGESATHSRTGTVSDNVGNQSSAAASFKIDSTAPLTHASAPSGWQQSAVTVAFSATDNLSTVARTEYSLDNGTTWTTGTNVRLTEGRHALQYRSTDVAGNVEGVQTATVFVDETAPSIRSTQSPSRPTSGWNSTDVTVTFTCEDGTSGVASCTGNSSTPKGVLVSAEGTTTVAGEAVDVAGNTGTTQHSVSIDKTDPTITGVAAGLQGLNGWHTGDLTVSFECSDPGAADTPATGSGIARCPDSTVLATEGAGQEVTGNAADFAGNGASVTMDGIKIDKTPPSTISNAPEGWQKDEVTVVFTPVDQEGLSGVAYTEHSLDGGRTWERAGSVTLGAGTHTVHFRSADQAGNVEQPRSVTVMIDKTAPTLTGDATGEAGENGWYTGDVTVTFTCGDQGGSTLAGACPADVLLGEGNGEQGEGQTVTRTVADHAGNETTTTVGPVRVDKTAPVTTADAPTDWSTTGVTVRLSATDNLSGIESTQYRLGDGAWTAYPATGIELGEGRHVLDYRSTDVAGNVEDVRSTTVDIDLSAPTIESSQSPAKNGAGWNSTDVTVTFDCADTGGSGVASCTGEENDPRGVLVTDEGDTTVTGTATDHAGNANSVGHLVRIDKTEPTISGHAAGTLGRNGWYTSDVEVSFTCADVDGSGIATGGCTSAATLGEGVGQSRSGTAADAAGNTASTTVSGVNVDKTPPVTSSDAPTGWQAALTTITFSAGDQAGLSGLDYTEYTLNGTDWTRAGSVTLGEGVHALQFRSVDQAGNVEAARAALVQVDLTGPTVSLQGPVTTADATVALSGTASDDHSGLVGVSLNDEAVTVSTSGAFNATVALACGSNTFTAVATDGVARTATATHTVTRTCSSATPAPVWSTQGFFAPVDMSTPTKKALNSVKGGSTVPLKFRIYKDGAEQPAAGVVTGLKVTAFSCDSGVDASSVDQLATGSTSLRYDGGQFIQNWKTPTAVGCYRAVVTHEGGGQISADFKVTK